MKRIAILSDTHAFVDPQWADYISGCDEVWHAGDIGDFAVIDYLRSLVPVVRAVRGNIDYGDVARIFPKWLNFEVEGLKVFMTHIGGYPGKYAPGIREFLEDIRPDIFVAGHSHILKVMPDPRLGLLHINPGAAGNHGWHQVKTLVRFSIDNAVPHDLEVIELPRFRSQKKS